MHTVVETPEYLAAAKAAGMTDAERDAAIDQIARNPEAGDIIPGSGGARKAGLRSKGEASRQGIG